MCNNHDSIFVEHPRLDLSTTLSCELITVRAGRWLASRFCSLVLQHYELASTTVTGIPMKEEQNASSSANYDVEIFHSVAAHADILKLKVLYQNCKGLNFYYVVFNMLLHLPLPLMMK